MPGRRLQWWWRCVLAAYLLALATIATGWLLGERSELLVAVLVGVLVVGGTGSMVWLRPRPFQPDSNGREEAETLRALRGGQFAGTVEQRVGAVDAARRTLFGLLPQILLWSVMALTNLDGRRVGDWLAAVAVIALVGCAVGLVLARWRMFKLDRWESRPAALGPASTTGEGA